MKLTSFLFAILTLTCLQLVNAQDFALSKKYKSDFLIPLLDIKDQTLVLNNKTDDLSFELWDNSLQIQTKVQNVDNSELKQLGKTKLFDAFTNGKIIAIIQTVDIKKANNQDFYIATYTTEGELIQSWAKLGSLKKKRLWEEGKRVSIQSADKNILLIAIKALGSSEKYKILMGYRFSDGKMNVINMSSTKANIAIREFRLSVNNSGTFAFWFHGNKIQNGSLSYSKPNQEDIGHHELFTGNIFSGTLTSSIVSGKSLEITSATPLVNESGDIYLFGMLGKIGERSCLFEKYFAATYNEQENEFKFKYFNLKAEDIEQLRGVDKVDLLLLYLQVRGAYLHQNGEITLVFEYHHDGWYFEDVNYADFGSIYATHFSTTLEEEYSSVLYKHRRSMPTEKMGSFIFLHDNKLQFLITDNPQAWLGTTREPNFEQNDYFQSYKCTPTLATFTKDGFIFKHVEYHDNPYHCIDLEFVRLTSPNQVFGFACDKKTGRYVTRIKLWNE